MESNRFQTISLLGSIGKEHVQGHISRKRFQLDDSFPLQTQRYFLLNEFQYQTSSKTDRYCKHIFINLRDDFIMHLGVMIDAVKLQVNFISFFGERKKCAKKKIIKEQPLSCSSKSRSPLQGIFYISAQNRLSELVRHLQCFWNIHDRLVRGSMLFIVPVWYREFRFSSSLLWFWWKQNNYQEYLKKEPSIFSK